VFSYNSAAVGVAGKLIEAVTGSSYEVAVRELVIDPLGLSHSRFFAADVAQFAVATSHSVDDGVPSTTPYFFEYERGKNPVGGLISSARDQLRYARFHLGDGSVPGSRQRLLAAPSLRACARARAPAGR
jgi:CubicO group peptidase (beta-lactamase class C family)